MQNFFPMQSGIFRSLHWVRRFLFLSNSMAMLVRAEGAVKEGLIGNLLGTLVNCIFDPLFILVLNFGVSGAAAASVLGNLVATGCYLRYIVKHGTVLTIDLRRYENRSSLAFPPGGGGKKKRGGEKKTVTVTGSRR